MPKVAIVGAGLIGRSWAIVFAQGGFDVALFDATPGIADKACDFAANGLRELAGHGLVADPQAAALRLRAAPSLADALAGAGFVQENLPETLEAKRAVFAELDRLAAPEAILASSTSTIVPSLFTENLRGRQRCLVAHPVNPPHLVPLVELLGAPWTAPETIATAKQIYQTVGQVPIVVRREIDGFILNRLQAALLAEAFRLAGEGFVSPQDLDETLKNGLGLRWSFMGPFATIELNAPGGIPDYCARYGASLSRLSAADPTIYAGDNLARILAEWGCNPTPQEIGEAMRRRDQRLAALKAHKREQQIE
jgi:3-hydroxyacyl-CoA dehydrogenase